MLFLKCSMPMIVTIHVVFIVQKRFWKDILMQNMYHGHNCVGMYVSFISRYIYQANHQQMDIYNAITLLNISTSYSCLLICNLNVSDTFNHLGSYSRGFFFSYCAIFMDRFVLVTGEVMYLERGIYFIHFCLSFISE